ncbi:MULTISPECIES: hypothetical protein [Vibrio]|uniref:Uncharacterized protein n=1 Tax=Vibrio cholerae TaxID=666 RepID=A0A5Q6PEN5_VIBCL|nr:MULTISPECIES: hypothetical protein [Vibrio]EJG0766601.1 hypothetical protein [Vibrio parahaemolyticus O5:K30]EGR2221598.1 hypothetical protein [Vibrio parahaemolyticus]EGR2855054.1 hypothetical protein [Vibrio parahaemolyticus]EGR2988749.1 hypothetical protein [Vibrio parahaemolyticus]EGR5855593.1 hypothetical protein [Vibrio parahaemolyticus]
MSDKELEVRPYDPLYKQNLKRKNLKLVTEAGYIPTCLAEFHFRIRKENHIIDFYPSTETWIIVSNDHTKPRFGMLSMIRFLDKI